MYAARQSHPAQKRILILTKIQSETAYLELPNGAMNTNQKPFKGSNHTGAEYTAMIHVLYVSIGTLSMAHCADIWYARLVFRFSPVQTTYRLMEVPDSFLLSVWIDISYNNRENQTWRRWGARDLSSGDSQAPQWPNCTAVPYPGELWRRFWNQFW